MIGFQRFLLGAKDMTARRGVLASLMLAIVLAGCSTPGPGEAPDGIWDPQEGTNRRIHDFNRRVDERLLKDNGTGLSDGLPQGTKLAVAGFADTAGTPQTIVNQLLQLRLWRATKNTLRFALNTTVGLTVMDPASEWGLVEDASDFGETLAVWGLPEGAYVELPLLGPSTERDATGSLVDLFTNPISYIVPAPERYLGPAANIADKLISRSEYSDTVESVLYGSADSYAQTRLIYLQNRRFELGETAPEAEEIDPMALDTSGF